MKQVTMDDLRELLNGEPEPTESGLIFRFDFDQATIERLTEIATKEGYPNLIEFLKASALNAMRQVKLAEIQAGLEEVDKRIEAL